MDMRKKQLIIPLLLYCFFSISITYASYKNKTNGNGSVNGASWQVSFVGNNEDISIVSGNTEQSYVITVSNNSEVDVLYSIKITNLPNNTKVKLDNGSYIEEENNEIVFENVGTILCGENPKNHTLTFTASLDAEEVQNQNFNIKVEFKQKLN